MHAIAGTHVVLLGIDLAPELVTGLLGFAIERTDHTEGERYHLDNFLLFEANDRGERPDHSSVLNPFQEFVWGDYTAKPRHLYTYRVAAMYGAPGALDSGPTTSVQVSTESQDDGRHSVLFNRGVAASQAYARRFKNRAPRDVPNREAYKWLSRGLFEGLLEFVGQASDERFALRAAVYEFEYEPVVAAFREAADAGADVHLVYDAVSRASGRTKQDNEQAIEHAGLEANATPRTKTKIAHNKFVVLLRAGQPEQVWTGSTNITEGGIFGHANVGHVVRDRGVAQHYLDFWTKLAGDPPRDEVRAFTDASLDVPLKRPSVPETIVFSPRTRQDALDWYVRLADSAEGGVFLTAAFGLGKEIAPVFTGDRDYLRYLLLDTERGDIEAVRRDPDNRVAAGGYIGKGGWRQWIEEKTTNLNGHVDYVHLKFMLVDPLTDHPLVITGSANWSDESAKLNDENMIVVSGDTRVADIYLGEFMRLFNHFRLRGKAKSPPTQLEPGPGVTRRERQRLYLRDDDSWGQAFYEAGSPESKERILFG